MTGFVQIIKNWSIIWLDLFFKGLDLNLYNWSYPQHSLSCPKSDSIIELVLSIPEFVLYNVLNINRFVLNITGFVINRAEFVLNMNGLVINMTMFFLNMNGAVLNTSESVL